VASLWEPPSSVWKADRTVASEFLWAALDCPAIWGQIVRQGGKIIAGAAIFSESGQLLVEARQTMIATQAGVPVSLAAWASV
jgi:hypothetical protein